MPRGQSPASQTNLAPEEKRANAAKPKGRPENLVMGKVAEHVAAAQADAEATGTKGRTDLLGALEDVLAEALTTLKRELRRLARNPKAKPDSAMTMFMDKTRMLINDCQAYRDRLSTDEPAMLVAQEMVNALRAANTSPESPAGPPEVEPEPDGD